jgi:hypothetical protein
MPPRFPKPVAYNNVAGRHYLTKKELNALYFATHELRRPRGWTNSVAVGRYWRAALVVFSTMVSIRELSGEQLPLTSRFCGGMCAGIGMHQIAC